MRKWLFLAIVPFLFSGCAVVTSYKNEYISKEINPFLQKVDSKEYSFCINNKKDELERTPGDKKFVQSLIIDVGLISSNVFKEFLNQYFSNIYLENKCSNHKYNINIDVIDFRYEQGFITGSALIKYSYRISVFKENIKILDTKYDVEDENKIVWRIGGNAKDDAVQLFHKSLLNHYEIYVKQDLLNAL